MQLLEGSKVTVCINPNSSGGVTGNPNGAIAAAQTFSFTVTHIVPFAEWLMLCIVRWQLERRWLLVWRPLLMNNLWACRWRSLDRPLTMVCYFTFAAVDLGRGCVLDGELAAITTLNLHPRTCQTILMQFGDEVDPRQITVRIGGKPRFGVWHAVVCRAVIDSR